MRTKFPVFTAWLLLIALSLTACSAGDSSPTSTAPAPASAGPVANAGPDQGSIATNTRVTLNGSGSTNPAGTPLTYQWAFTSIPAGSGAVVANATSVSPSFALDLPGLYIVQLLVNAVGATKSTVDAVTITTGNVAPVANPGPNQGSKATRSLITLDGSKSADRDGDLFTYSWALKTIPNGSTAVLTGAGVNNSLPTATFILDQAGLYIAQLIVNDGTVNSQPATVIITSVNVAPVANAGRDQGHVLSGTLVTLDGRGSHDDNFDQLSFSWMLTKPEGSSASLNDADTRTPTFKVDRDGVYIAQLIVNDGTVPSEPDTVTITSDNVAPVADAGRDQAAKVGDLVLLSGSDSRDDNFDQLRFNWALTGKPQGSAAGLVNAGKVSPSFTIDLPGSYVVQLIVNDGTVPSEPDTVVISTGNVAPVANAGPDQGIKDPGSIITLDGRKSSDANGDSLTYRWAFSDKPSGSAAELQNSTTKFPTFKVDRAGDYVIKLIVNDGTVDSDHTDSDSNTVKVTTKNVAPVANAGGNQLNIEPNTVITLDGSLSSDANGDSLTYRWAFSDKPSGSAAELQNSTTKFPTFKVDRAGPYVVKLIVKDGTDDSLLPATVTVTTKDVPPVANAGADQTVPVCRPVVLNGSESFDPNGISQLSYNWTLPIKPSSTITTNTSSNTSILSQVTLANSLNVKPSFTTPLITGVPGSIPTSGQNVADLAGLYQAQLTVSDGESALASVDVTAQETYVVSGGLASTTTVFGAQCASCHFIGSLGTGLRNSSKQGLGVESRFVGGLKHRSISTNTLNPDQILDMCVFFQTH